MLYRRKQLFWFTLLCGAFFALFQLYPNLAWSHSWFAVGKYLTSVYGLLSITCLLLSYLPFPLISSTWIRLFCGYIGIGIVLFYTILTLDTFVFHAMNWYPAILRYAVFSAYGLLYSGWCMIGVLIYIGCQEVK